MKFQKSAPYFIIVAFCLVLSIASVSNYLFSQTRNAQTLADQYAQLESIQAEIDTKSKEYAQMERDTVQSITGLDSSRVQSDNKIAQDFLKKVLTWDSYEDYNNLREMCLSDYHVDPDSRFMKTFLPEVPLVVSKDGSEYNKIDLEGLNSRYESMNTYVRDINESTNGTYSYFSFVDASVVDSKFTHGESTMSLVFLYDVDADGNLLNLDAYGNFGR